MPGAFFSWSFTNWSNEHSWIIVILSHETAIIASIGYMLFIVLSREIKKVCSIDLTHKLYPNMWCVWKSWIECIYSSIVLIVSFPFINRQKTRNIDMHIRPHFNGSWWEKKRITVLTSNTSYIKIKAFFFWSQQKLLSENTPSSAFHLAAWMQVRESSLSSSRDLIIILFSKWQIYF